jgi:hypothetical protein
VSGGRNRDVMENNPIIVDELHVSKKTMVGVRTVIEREVWVIRTSPIEGQVDLTPSKVIAGVVARFKRKKVSTPIETSVPSSIKALVMAFPLLQLLTLLIEAAAIGPFTWAILESIKLENVFANLIID